VIVSCLSCNHLVSPLAVGPEPPWLSWRIEADDAERDVAQASARVVVPGVWDSGVIETPDPWIAWDGPPLTSFTEYRWSVSVTTADGQVITSDWATFETGPLSAEEWSAIWITRPRPKYQHDDHRPAIILRRCFDAATDIARARLYVTAGGLYRASLNGHRVGDDELTPGWTDFSRRVHYQAYEVTDLLVVGSNSVEVVLADGWYCGAVGPNAMRATYGDQPCLLAELVMWKSDGSRTSVASDESWQCCFGPVLAADLLLGESHDAREPIARAWSQATVVDGPAGRLLAKPCSPPRVVARIRPVSLSEPSPGSYVFDLGQNMVGRARLRLRAGAGTIVRLRHAEMLDSLGRIYTDNLRRARATDTFIARGGEEVFEPAFTFHGFRYVEVTGLPRTPELEDLEGVAVSSAATQTGEFECSNPMLNRLQSNIRWGQLGNFLEVPTDCPQRDERLGWMGDAQIFAPTACFNADVAAFFGKWLTDVADAADQKGFFTDVAPLPKMAEDIDLPSAAPGWGDAGVIVPWVVYQYYGDRRLLEAMYPLISAWVDSIHKANPGLVWEHRRGFDFGDWLSLGADTPKDVVATAYFAHSASLAAAIAAELGRTNDAAAYQRLSEGIAEAFRVNYVDAAGRVAGHTQTAYALALKFGLLLPEQRSLAAAHLADDVKRRGYRVTTGFLGAAHLLPALSDNGYLDLAYQLLLSENIPSWGYPIRQGATTMWERWDGWTEDRGFQDPGMNSFNHYAFGAVGVWLYSVIGGIRADQVHPGWGRIIFEPRPGGGIEWARCHYKSVRGRVACEWSLEGSGSEAGQGNLPRLVVSIEVPPTATAEVRLPCAEDARVSESGRPIADVARGRGTASLQVGSGSYRFEVAGGIT
jgi:alpha-L-rhamnosidase